MPPELPARIRIEHDDHHARYVGRTGAGLQYFLTTPFVPALSDAGREFIAVYLFDEDGVLVEARIDDLGPRAQLDREAARRLEARRLADLGTVTLEAIEVAPFELERFGTRFGLIPQAPAEDDDDPQWSIVVEPGNYMAFYPPWDGEYDT